jgi:NAD(P)-dependent dehydrogenase (short-subunit alcohol dehydrogenase family)
MPMNIIVTGAFGALGRALLSRLADGGNIVAAVDIATDADANAALSLGGVDLSDTESVGAAFLHIAQQIGLIDALVNVAGGFVWESMQGGSSASWDRMYEMNVKTSAVACQQIIDLIADGGSIVNVGAAAALSPGVGMAPYAASKAGVQALTVSLAGELRDRRIRVNAVLPAILDTPANRAQMPEADPSTWVAPLAVADAISWLLSRESRAVTGAAIPLACAC